MSWKQTRAHPIPKKMCTKKIKNRRKLKQTKKGGQYVQRARRARCGRKADRQNKRMVSGWVWPLEFFVFYLGYLCADGAEKVNKIDFKAPFEMAFEICYLRDKLLCLSIFLCSENLTISYERVCLSLWWKRHHTSGNPESMVPFGTRTSWIRAWLGNLLAKWKPWHRASLVYIGQFWR